MRGGKAAIVHTVPGSIAMEIILKMEYLTQALAKHECGGIHGHVLFKPFLVVPLLSKFIEASYWNHGYCHPFSANLSTKSP